MANSRALRHIARNVPCYDGLAPALRLPASSSFSGTGKCRAEREARRNHTFLAPPQTGGMEPHVWDQPCECALLRRACARVEASCLNFFFWHKEVPRGRREEITLFSLRPPIEAKAMPREPNREQRRDDQLEAFSMFLGFMLVCTRQKLIHT